VSPRRPPVPIGPYEASVYGVVAGGREVAIRIGRTSPELDALFDARGAASGICITAANPFSEWQTSAVNAAANDRLVELLRAGGWRTLPHVGRSPDGTWVEAGFFVLDLDEAAALAIAERFGQFGIVAIGRGRPARLVLTRLAQGEDGEGF
jgi:hypothetical protein